jgi:hypothetical protein
MLAMQYSIPLPHDYDAARIRERVQARSGLFDHHKGLVHKSFLYNAQEQLYAPFYVWKDVVEAGKFLQDDLFKGVIETFRRHRVRSWFVIHMEYGNRGIAPTHAMRETDMIAPEERLDHFLGDERQAQQALLRDDNLYMHLVALDADRWEILRFSLWKDKACCARPASDSFSCYDVLHVSTPAG